MSKQINISNEINKDDIYYRYKRDRLETKNIKSKGNQIVIVNLWKICCQLTVSQLSVNEKLIMQLWIKKNLINNIKKNFSIPIREEKEKGNDYNNKIYLKGNTITIDDLEKIINNFTVKYLLCPSCNLPEYIPKIDAISKNQCCFACRYTNVANNITRKEKEKEKEKVVTNKTENKEEDEDEQEGKQKDIDSACSDFIHTLDDWKIGKSEVAQSFIEKLISKIWDVDNFTKLNDLYLEFSSYSSSVCDNN